MSNLRSLALTMLVLACAACGDSSVVADAGVYDASAGMCSCARPGDCASGVCCVAFDRTPGGEVVRSKCVATQLDCVYYSTPATTQTTACEKDGDCGSESADGGTRSCTAPTLPGFCGAKVCR